MGLWVKVFMLVLFLNGYVINVPGTFDDKTVCIESGTAQIKTYKQFHPHSAAWFWCAEGNKT